MDNLLKKIRRRWTSPTYTALGIIVAAMILQSLSLIHI